MKTKIERNSDTFHTHTHNWILFVLFFFSFALFKFLPKESSDHVWLLWWTKQENERNEFSNNRIITKKKKHWDKAWFKLFSCFHPHHHQQHQFFFLSLCYIHSFHWFMTLVMINSWQFFFLRSFLFFVFILEALSSSSSSLNIIIIRWILVSFFLFCSYS